jgi:hypothetical protein
VLVRPTEPPAAGTGANYDPVSAIRAWGDSLIMDQRVIAEIKRFEKKEGDFGEPYPLQLASGIRRLVFECTASGVANLLAGRCTTQVEVAFPEPGFAAAEGGSPEKKSEKKFEDAFVWTEALACFTAEGVTPDEALQIFTSEEFRMEESSRIKRIWMQDGEFCMEIDGIKMILSPTLSCSRIDVFHAPGFAMEHSQVVSNGNDEDYQEVYFKESVKAFIAIPGGIALYYINFTRATDLGWPKKSLSAGKIKESRVKAINELRKRLDSIGEGD